MDENVFVWTGENKPKTRVWAKIFVVFHFRFQWNALWETELCSLYFANQHETMAIIPSLEPDADDCKLHNSYDVQSCIMAGVSLVLGTAVCFYGEHEIKFASLPFRNLQLFFRSTRSIRLSGLLKFWHKTCRRPLLQLINSGKIEATLLPLLVIPCPRSS